MKKNLLIAIISILFIKPFYSQEALKSVEEEYYDFLALQGITEKPTLGYRTLSDSVWKIKKDENGNELSHIWSGNNLGNTKTIWQAKDFPQNRFTQGFFSGVNVRIFGPEWFNSYNTASPYGQNDGALWQGKGYNTSFSSGIRLEGFGIEATFKPQLSFSQNRDFEYIKPNYSGSNFEGKAEKYGYYGVKSIDAPQRFGENSFWTYDWGDTEIRYTWHTLTLGFGTQSIWLGPAKLNPIMHSNNAPTYPKFDIGLRKTQIHLPYFNLYLGDIETRLWWGKLSESKYFDNDKGNDENLITGLSVNYSFPGMLKGLSLGVNRTMLSKWKDKNLYTMLDIFVPGLSNLTSGGDDNSDQRLSVIFDYKIQKVGFEIYLELAINDHPASFLSFLRDPFHTAAYTTGIRKNFYFSSNYNGELLLELSDLESSNDYGRTLPWSTTFYSHHKILQGYTNKGQWLGAGIGTGGNSQCLKFSLYNKKAKYEVFIQRKSIDLDYTWFVKDTNMGDISIGLGVENFITKNLLLTSGAIGICRLEKTQAAKTGSNEKKMNASVYMGFSYKF
ncbi:capsule assembly Wzi family protein [Treponema pectinovorum]|uniref:capsule assembly Wzi family protein n=1 Tax=Treponema pectinovorum TaxID=164 RepID=UPI0011CA55F0|nr:capsule assembly Wzi family protein [Treponema pectinovorum]